MKRRSLALAVALVIAFVAMPNVNPAFASGFTLSGQVTNPYGSVVPNVTVGLETTQGSFATGLTATTDGSGNYSIGGITQGAYYVGIHVNPGAGQTDAPQYLRVDTTALTSINANNSSFNLTIPEVRMSLHTFDDYGNNVAGTSFNVSSACPQSGFTLAGVQAQGCSQYTDKPDSQGNYRYPEPLTENSATQSGNAYYWVLPTAPNPYPAGSLYPNPYLYTIIAHSFSGCHYYTDESGSGTTNYSYTERSSFCPWSWAPYTSVTNVATGVSVGAASSSNYPYQGIQLRKPQTMSGRVLTPGGLPITDATVSLEASHGGAVVAQATTDGSGNYSMDYEPGSYYLRIQTSPNGTQQNAAQNMYVETSSTVSFGKSDTLTYMNDGYPASSYQPFLSSFFFCPGGSPNSGQYPLTQFEYSYFPYCMDVIYNPPSGNSTASSPVYGPNPWPAVKQVTSLDLTVPEHKVHVTVSGEGAAAPGTLSGINMGATSACPGATDPWSHTLAITTNAGDTWDANGCSIDVAQGAPVISTDSSGGADLWLLSTLPNPNNSSSPYNIQATPPTGSVYVAGTLTGVDVNSSDQSVTMTLKHVRPTFSCTADKLAPGTNPNPAYPGTPGAPQYLNYGYQGWSGAEITYSCTATDDTSDSSLPGGFPSTFSLSTSVGDGNASSTAFTSTQSVCDGAGFCVTAGPYGQQTLTDPVTHLPYVVDFLKVDRQKPTVNCTVDYTKWYSAQSGVPCTATDGSGSGLKVPTDLNFKLTVNANGTTNPYSVCDNVGNCQSAPSYSNVPVDLVLPTYSCGAVDTSQWYKIDQTVSCTASDTGTSGLATPASFTLSTKVPAGTSTTSAYTLGAKVCSNSGNCVSVAPFGPFKIDKRAPTAVVTSPAPNSVFLLGQSVTPSATCSDNGGSGVASCTLTPVDTSTVGPKTYTVNVSDVAGNTGVATSPYKVTYGVRMLSGSSLTALSGGPIAVQLTDANSTPRGCLGTMTGIKLTQTIAGEVKNFSISKPFTCASGAYSLSLQGWPAGSYTLYFQVVGDTVVHSVSFTFT